MRIPYEIDPHEDYWHPGERDTPITRRAATHKQPMSAQVLDRAREFRGDHRRVVDALPGEAEAGERLKQTALRDFGPVPEDRERRGRSYKLTLSSDDAPVSSCYMSANYLSWVGG